MNQVQPAGGAADLQDVRARGWRQPVPLTDLPRWLMAVLVGVGLPRTVLADLGIVEPESGVLYYVLALAPFAVWLGVAVARRTRRPVGDFLVLGFLYGLSLLAVHLVLWGVAPVSAHAGLVGAIGFAERFDGAGYLIALVGYLAAVAMLIGVGAGAVTALVALMAQLIRRKRRR